MMGVLASTIQRRLLTVSKVADISPVALTMLGRLVRKSTSPPTPGPGPSITLAGPLVMLMLAKASKLIGTP